MIGIISKAVERGISILNQYNNNENSVVSRRVNVDTMEDPDELKIEDFTAIIAVKFRPCVVGEVYREIGSSVYC